MLDLGKKLDPKFALFLFYNSLVLMYQNKPCINVIQDAINAC
jgi:hypothetical protein